MTRRRNAVQNVAAADLIEAQDRLATQAYMLRQRGLSWWDIAEQLQIGRVTAQNLVSERIAAASDMVSEQTKRVLLAMEVGRLDAVMAAHWDDALVDVRSAELVLKVIAARTKLLGLDTMADAVATHQTVVVAGTSEEYVRSLQLVVGNARRELGSGEDK